MIHLKVKKAMLDQGITVSLLAQRCGYSISHVSNVLNSKVSSEVAKKRISIALQISSEAWLDEEDTNR